MMSIDDRAWDELREKIIIKIRKGCVIAVTTNCKDLLGINVQIVDYDVKGYDPDIISEFDGGEAIVTNQVVNKPNE